MADQIGALPAGVLGTLADILLKLKTGSITSRQLELFAKGQNPFGVSVRTRETELARWVNVYEGLFPDLLKIEEAHVPEAPSYPARLIVIAKNLTFHSVLKVLKNIFRYQNECQLAQMANDRNSTGTYAVWVRSSVEASDEFSSGMMAGGIKIYGITLLERLMLELDHFLETGRHLDRKDSTFCTGSKCSNGSIPIVYWNRIYRMLFIRKDSHNGLLQTRAVHQ